MHLLTYSLTYLLSHSFIADMEVKQMMQLLAKRIKEMEIDISSDYKREQETEGTHLLTHLLTHSLIHSLNLSKNVKKSVNY